MNENMITSTNYIEGKEIKEYLGMVFGTTIRTRGILGNFIVFFESLKGGKIKSYLSELEKAKVETIKEMIKEADKLGADAILGVDWDMDEVLGNKMMVSMNGTAVKFKEGK
jgi:uncharacterized protein YbjQ (UPF0145 family)